MTCPTASVSGSCGINLAERRAHWQRLWQWPGWPGSSLHRGWRRTGVTAYATRPCPCCTGYNGGVGNRCAGWISDRPHDVSSSPDVQLNNAWRNRVSYTKAATGHAECPLTKLRYIKASFCLRVVQTWRARKDGSRASRTGEEGLLERSRCRKPRLQASKFRTTDNVLPSGQSKQPLRRRRPLS